jgi:hypothetical protein
VRVHAEEVTAALRVEWVQRHEQCVFLRDRRALPHDVGRDFAGRRIHARADVQGIVVVEQIDLGALRRRRVLDGVHLMQIVDARGIRPRRIVERAVDRGTRGGARDLDRLLPRVARRELLPGSNAGQRKCGNRRKPMVESAHC